jgi:hypothetical protein
MTVTVRAIPRAVHSMTAADEATALENKLNEGGGRLVQLIDSRQQPDWLLAVFDTGD